MRYSSYLLFVALSIIGLIFACTMIPKNLVRGNPYNPYAMGYTCTVPEIGKLRVLPICGRCVRNPVAR